MTIICATNNSVTTMNTVHGSSFFERNGQCLQREDSTSYRDSDEEGKGQNDEGQVVIQQTPEHRGVVAVAVIHAVLDRPRQQAANARGAHGPPKGLRYGEEAHEMPALMNRHCIYRRKCRPDNPLVKSPKRRTCFCGQERQRGAGENFN